MKEFARTSIFPPHRTNDYVSGCIDEAIQYKILRGKEPNLEYRRYGRDLLAKRGGNLNLLERNSVARINMCHRDLFEKKRQRK